MLCDGSPDPKITKEINTYINLWREDTDSRPVHKTIQECQDALKVRFGLPFCGIARWLCHAKYFTMLHFRAFHQNTE